MNIIMVHSKTVYLLAIIVIVSILSLVPEKHQAHNRYWETFINVTELHNTFAKIWINLQLSLFLLYEPWQNPVKEMQSAHSQGKDSSILYLSVSQHSIWQIYPWNVLKGSTPRNLNHSLVWGNHTEILSKFQTSQAV